MSQSNPGTANSETLPPLETDVGSLGDPEILDPADEAAVRRIVETHDEEQPAAHGAVTQQGRMKADVAVVDSRVRRAMQREAAADERIADQVRDFLSNEANGYLEIERLGPPEMPSIELGIIGTLRHSEIQSMPVAEVLKATVGGGFYRLIARRGDNTLADVDAVTIRVGGCDPKPKTTTGKRWLARVAKEGTLEEKPPAPENESGKSVTELLLAMLERDKERDRIRADQEEAKRTREAEEKKQEWKERAEAAKAERAKEIEDLKALRERERAEAAAARERDATEFKRRTDAETASAKARLDAQIEQMKLESAARLEQMKAEAELARDRQKMLLDAESRRIEAKDTGGLGFEGLGKVREMLAEAVGKAALKSAGIDDEEEDTGLGGAFADVLRQEGPELLRTAAGIFLPKLANFLPGAAAAPAPAPAAPVARALPSPGEVPDFSAASAPAPEPANAEVPAVAEQPAPHPGVPTREIAARAATSYAFNSVLGFVRPLGVLALAQPDPSSTWDIPVEDGRTLEDLYRAMPKNARETAAADWDRFMAAVKEASEPDATLFADAIAADGGAEWLKGVLAVGPWVPEETE